MRPRFQHHRSTQFFSVFTPFFISHYPMRICASSECSRVLESAHHSDPHTVHIVCCADDCDANSKHYVCVKWSSKVIYNALKCWWSLQIRRDYYKAKKNACGNTSGSILPHSTATLVHPKVVCKALKYQQTLQNRHDYKAKKSCGNTRVGSIPPPSPASQVHPQAVAPAVLDNGSGHSSLRLQVSVSQIPRSFNDDPWDMAYFSFKRFCFLSWVS